MILRLYEETEIIWIIKVKLTQIVAYEGRALCYLLTILPKVLMAIIVMSYRNRQRGHRERSREFANATLSGSIFIPAQASNDHAALSRA